MRNLLTSPVSRARKITNRLGPGDETCGTFVLRSPIDREPMFVIASSGGGWDHVSVSRKKRCPNWPEMEFVRRAFFADDEIVMQLHVPPSEHVNYHPNCLHMWRPNDGAVIPTPPSWMVGPRDGETPEQAEAIGHAELEARGEL